MPIYNINTPTTELPDDWLKINLLTIQSALDGLSFKNKQFFGHTELKKIYQNAHDKLTAQQIEKSLNEFAYGLQNYINEEPYVSMKNPGSIIFKRLSNGDTWVEGRFLTPVEQNLKCIYVNISNKLEVELDKYFHAWLNENKNEKYEYYRNTIPSTHYYSDREFIELAREDYQNNIWPHHKITLITDYMGTENKNLIEKLVQIETQNRSPRMEQND